MDDVRFVCNRCDRISSLSGGGVTFGMTRHTINTRSANVRFVRGIVRGRDFTARIARNSHGTVVVVFVLVVPVTVVTTNVCICVEEGGSW